MGNHDTAVHMGNLPDTPLGEIWLASTRGALVGVSLWGRERFVADVIKSTGQDPVFAPEVVKPFAEQIATYLHGKRKQFDMLLDWSVMTPFQEKVLRAVCEVDYGRVSSYGEIAERIGRPTAVRAVGRANGSNPMPIIIPCHRILGRDGKLHGYSTPGGLETKAWLLRLEGSWLI